MSIHFEDLWEICEKLNKESSLNEVSLIIEELLIKINLYLVFDQKKEIPIEEQQKIKSRIFGEILFTLTSLSLKNNINVFESLADSYKEHGRK